MYTGKSIYSNISVYIGNSWHLKYLAKPPEITETNYSTGSTIFFFSPAYRSLRTDKCGYQPLATVKSFEVIRHFVNNARQSTVIDIFHLYLDNNRNRTIPVYQAVFISDAESLN